jgi:DNA primase
MAFPNRLLEDIRARTGLADTIARKVKLTRRGREHVGLCPFHHEKSPSFTVNEEKGFYHCFGCGAHGDVISFVMNTAGLSFPEAVERLAGDAGLEIPVETPEAREQAKRQAGLHDVMAAACTWFEGQLRAPGGRAALDYLRGRGLLDGTIAKFRLGFAPGGGALRAALGAQGIGEAQMIEAGLLRRPDDGRAPYPFFRDRVLFPIADRRDRVIAFGGRLMGDVKAAKYINSPDTPLFDKGRTLYNYALARQASFEAGQIVVAEGYMDVIALSQAGIEAAVAPLGTAVSDQQILALWQLAPEPVLCFDGDTAGQRAAGRVAERVLALLTPGKSLRFAMLPPGEDPDSLLASQGSAAMRQVLEAARPLSSVIWDIESGLGPLDTPERRADLQARLRKRTDEIADPTVREHYRTMFKERLWTAFRPPRTKRGARVSQSANSESSLRGRVDQMKRRAQQAILAALINHLVLRDEFAEALDAVTFDADLDKLRQRLQNLFAARIDLDIDGVRTHFSQSADGRLLDGVLDSQVYALAPFAGPKAEIEDARQGLGHLLLRRGHERLKREVAQMGRLAAESDSPEDEARAMALNLDAVENDRRLAEIDEQAGNWP